MTAVTQRLAQAVSWRLERLAQRLDGLRRALVVVNYHRLYHTALDTPFDEGVFGDVSLEYFRRQLQWLRQNTQVLSEDDVLRGLADPKVLPRRGVLITFDDGYRDNFQLAYPALRDHGLLALFFVPTGPLLERRLGWWDQAAFLVKKAKSRSLRLEGATYPLDTQDQRRKLITMLHERFKTAPEAQTRGLLDDLAQGLDSEFPAAELQDAELMTFAQLGEMSRAGMAVGAHTHSHRVLATLPADDQRRELAQGKAVLEERLGKPVRSLAYPVGRKDSFGEVTKGLAREAGYLMAFSFYSGFNRPGRMDPMDLRRSFKRKPFEAFTASILYPGRELRPMA